MRGFVAFIPPPSALLLAFCRAMLYYMIMFNALRIICSVISALAVAACIFIFVYLGTLWGIVTLAVAAAFFGLTMLFRSLAINEEQKMNPPPAKGDFITGKRGEDK